MTAQPFKTFVLDLLRQDYLDEEASLQELSETERAANGTWELWSAKDHMAHRMFWHQNLVQNLTAILRNQEVLPREEDDDSINARVFEEHRLRSWSEVHAESRRVNAELIALVEQISEEDLTASNRFTAITGDRPLYIAFLGSQYEHDQEHLAQYYRDHSDLPRAIQIREKCASRIMQSDMPEQVKGYFLYNMACFYTGLHQLEKAAALLQEALTLAPDLREWSMSDPDLAALRDQTV